VFAPERVALMVIIHPGLCVSRTPRGRSRGLKGNNDRVEDVATRTIGQKTISVDSLAKGDERSRGTRRIRI
jgi:ribosome biogenesis SPOUT family RNA methylase Rps3